jgi:hypothetical protein
MNVATMRNTEIINWKTISDFLNQRLDAVFLNEPFKTLMG